MNTRVVHFYFDLDQTEIPHGSKMPELAQGGTTVLGGELLIFGGVILSPTGIKFQDKLYGFPLKNIPLFSGTNFHYFFFFFFVTYISLRAPIQVYVEVLPLWTIHKTQVLVVQRIYVL